ncbi:hypothetical protein, partial [Phocaeicola sp.]|uniref:hypothetical protein n=1 Tax=Phocaeicola sp. TaxID=2773926 RepID=UPI0040275259
RFPFDIVFLFLYVLISPPLISHHSPRPGTPFLSGCAAFLLYPFAPLWLMNIRFRAILSLMNHARQACLCVRFHGMYGKSRCRDKQPDENTLYLPHFLYFCSRFTGRYGTNGKFGAKHDL